MSAFYSFLVHKYVLCSVVEILSIILALFLAFYYAKFMLEQSCMSITHSENYNIIMEFHQVHTIKHLVH